MADENPDISAQWKALNPQQRDAALARMSPEQKQKLATDLGFKAPPATEQPEARTVGNYLSEAVSGAGRGLINDVTGAYQTVRHPIDTAKGLTKQLSTAQEASTKEFNDLESAYPNKYSPTRNAASMLTFAENAPIIGGMIQHAEKGGTRMASPESVGAASEGFTTLAAPDIVGRGVGKMLPKVARSIAKTGPKEMRGLVKDTAASNEAAVADAAKANTKAANEHMEKTQEALHATEGAELKHKQAVEQSKDEAATATKMNLKKHLQSREEAIRERAEAEQRLIAEKMKQGKIAPLQAKLQTAWSNLRAAIETARERALKVGNSKYNTVNEKLNPIPSDMAGPSAAYAEAANSFGDVLNQPPLLKRLGSLLEEPAKGETKSPVTYKDEQQLYSELGNELSRGGLNGPTYHAYDLIHEALGKDMQRIADLQGMGKQLLEARNYWRRMKQTFGKQMAVSDAASRALKGSASNLAEDAAKANQIRLLGSFDSDIPSLYTHVSNIEKGVDALPEPVSGRAIVNGEKAPSIPPRKPILPKVEPKPVVPPERIAPPNRPAEVVPATKNIDLEDIRNKKVESAEKGVQRARKVGHKIVNYGIVIKALWNVFGGNFAAVPGDIGMGLAGYGATEAFARMLERPAIRKLLTEPTPADIAQIPPELRGNLGPMIQAAQAKGIKVAPALIAATTGAAVAGHPRKGVAAALTAK